MSCWGVAQEVNPRSASIAATDKARRLDKRHGIVAAHLPHQLATRGVVSRRMRPAPCALLSVRGHPVYRCSRLSWTDIPTYRSMTVFRKHPTLWRMTAVRSQVIIPQGSLANGQVVNSTKCTFAGTYVLPDDECLCATRARLSDGGIP